MFGLVEFLDLLTDPFIEIVLLLLFVLLFHLKLLFFKDVLLQRVDVVLVKLFHLGFREDEETHHT